MEENGHRFLFIRFDMDELKELEDWRLLSMIESAANQLRVLENPKLSSEAWPITAAELLTVMSALEKEADRRGFSLIVYLRISELRMMAAPGETIH
jgi:hypothetical protein